MSNQSKLTYDKLCINGMTCTSCEVIIERKLKQLPGVEKVQVNHSTGECRIYSQPDTILHLSEIQQLITDKGYTASLWQETNPQRISEPTISRKRHWAEIGAMFLIVFALYSVLKSTGVFSLSSSIDNSFSLGAVFVIGLVAATSTCIAVVGGLVLSVSSKHNETNPNASGWQKFRPHLLFNVGRLISYFVLGGLIGLVGKALTPSPQFTGWMTVGIAVVMVLLGLDILKLFKTKKFIPRMPKWLSHKIHNLSENDRPWTPLILGGLTFFLPCGFTQSMQLYALTTGSFWKGGLTMLVFALGTLPALVGIGMVSSFAKGTVSRYFLKFSGVMVLLLGVYNLNNGLTLTGVDAAAWFESTSSVAQADTASIQVVGGKQVVKMAVNGMRYEPATLTVAQNIPVEWHIDGSTAQGCAAFITSSKLNIAEALSPTEETIINFTPQELGTVSFTCSMGMTRGQFIVVENT